MFMLEEIPKLKNWEPDIDKGENVFYTTDRKAKMYVAFDKIFKNKELAKTNIFILQAKQNFATMKELHVKYINYFIKYFDEDDSLVKNYLSMKYMIDTKLETYSEDLFILELFENILNESTVNKIKEMTELNYEPNIQIPPSSRKINYQQAIQLTHDHLKILFNISTAMKLVIPIMTHYAYIHNMKTDRLKNFILRCFRQIMCIMQGDVDIYIKLFSTIKFRVDKTVREDSGHWKRVSIDGDDAMLRIEYYCDVTIETIIHKYIFDGSIVSLNTATVKNFINNMMREKTNYNVKIMSSDPDDEDGMNDFDKIEMNNSTMDESFPMMNRINIEQVIEMLCDQYQIYIEQKELDYYLLHMKGKIKIIQRELVFTFFTKYFGATRDLYSISLIQYIKFIIILKRILINSQFKLFQYIISGDIKITENKKILNKKLEEKIQNSPRYKHYEDMYAHSITLIKNSNIFNNTLSKILNSTITLVDYDLSRVTDTDSNNFIDSTGKRLRIQENIELVCDEFLRFVFMI